MPISIDPARTAHRVEELSAYYAANVLTDDGQFICGSSVDCEWSALKKPDTGFYAAQGIAVSPSYDVENDGVPLRVLIVPMETGRERKNVSIQQRTDEVRSLIGKPWASWNPHMRGVGMALQLAFGLPLDTSDDGLWLAVNGGNRVHVLDAYAMANLLMCSATKIGSASSRATSVMRAKCSTHLLATVDVLKPTLLISQGATLSQTLRGILGVVEEHGPNVTSCERNGERFIWADLHHPTRNWDSPARPYFIDTVVPALKLGRSLALALPTKHGELVLVPTPEPDIYLVLGETNSGALRQLPGELVPFSSGPDLVDYRSLISESLAAANVGAQGLNALFQAQGLMRLAPETMRLMQGGARVLAKDGWNLGALAAKNGEIVAQVRWLPAASATGTALLAAAGPALVMMSIQFQLAQIEKRVQHNIDLTTELLQMTREDHWSELQADRAMLTHTLELRERNGMSDDVWNRIPKSSERNMIKQRTSYFKTVERLSADLAKKRGAPSRSEWLVDHAAAVLTDVRCLIDAENHLALWRLMEIENLALKQQREPAAHREELIADLRGIAERDRSSSLQAVQELLDPFYRQLRIMEACPGRMGLKIAGRRKTPREVAATAQAMADQIQPGVLAQPLLKVPPTYGRDRPKVLSILRWLLKTDERLLALVHGQTHAKLPRVHEDYLVITDHRVLWGYDDGLEKRGELSNEIALDDLVRSYETGVEGRLDGYQLVFASRGRECLFDLDKSYGSSDAMALVTMVRDPLGYLGRHEKAIIPIEQQ